MADIVMVLQNNPVALGYRLVAPVVLASGATENQIKVGTTIMRPSTLLGNLVRQFAVRSGPAVLQIAALLTGAAGSATLTLRLGPPAGPLPLWSFTAMTGPSATQVGHVLIQLNQLTAEPEGSYFNLAASVGAMTLADLWIYVV